MSTIAAVAALTTSKINGQDAVFKAAYDPLMYAADQPGLLGMYLVIPTWSF
jgi:hypothetical protein